MANYITIPLKTGSIKYRDRQLPIMRQPIANTEAPIQRIGGKDGTCATFDRKKERTRVDREAALYAEGMWQKKLMLVGVRKAKCNMPLCDLNLKQGSTGESCWDKLLRGTSNISKPLSRMQIYDED